MRRWVQLIKENWHKLYFVLGIGFIIFGYGFLAGKYELFPYRHLRPALDAAADWIKFDNYKHYLGIRPEKVIEPAHHSGSGVTINKSGKTREGVTFLASYWDDATGMRLIDMDGKLINEWRVALTDILEEVPHRAERIDDWDTHIHGTYLFPNGDVIFNFAHNGLIKIDRCSNVVWKIAKDVHHSIYVDAEGFLWVSGRTIHSKKVDRLPLLNPEIYEDLILKISPEGKVLKEISILDAFYNSGLEAILFATGQSKPKKNTLDITHLNDVEILEKSMADAFPEFNAGDIMISMRHLNMIAIVDPVAEKIKWRQTGPYMRQHDPDFLPNGRILIFDNRSDYARGTVFGGSRILSLDPVTRDIQTVYEGNDENSFYTNSMGKHQRLDNGNLLITESLEGRVFEVTPEGEVVWSYINRYDEDEAYRVTEGTRYDDSYREFAEGPEKCPETE